MIVALLIMAKLLVDMAPFLARELFRMVPFAGLRTASMALLEGWHLHMALLRAIVTPFLAFSCTDGLSAVGPMEPRLESWLIYMPLPPAPRKVTALLLAIVAALFPALASLAAFSAVEETLAVPVFLASIALSLRRMTLKWVVDEVIVELGLPSPMPKWVVPWPPSEAI